MIILFSIFSGPPAVKDTIYVISCFWKFFPEVYRTLHFLKKSAYVNWHTMTGASGRLYLNGRIGQKGAEFLLTSREEPLTV